MNPFFGWGVGDIVAIAKLAAKVYTAYKDAPDEYKHIAEEVDSLQGMINKAVHYFESTALSDHDRQQGQSALRGCQSVLEDLISLIEKYKSLASTNTSQILQRVKLGTEDITALRARLTSNALLLNGFNQSCGFIEIQARLTDVLGLHRTSSSSSLSIDSVASFASSVDTKEAFKMLCRDLLEIGVTAELISEKKEEILNIFRAQNTTPSGQIDSTSIPDNSQSPAQKLKRPRFGWIWPIGVFGPPMIAAAEAGDTKRLISTLKYIQNIDFKDESKETALHKAVAKGHKDVVQVLLGNGASIEVRDRYKRTPLYVAALNGHMAIVDLLHRKGASIESTIGIFSQLMIAAAEAGDTKRLISTLRYIQNIDFQSSISRETALHKAAAKGHKDIVQVLLENSASIEARDSSNRTPLHFAAWSGHTAIVELLLGRGASIESMDGIKDTPLHCAARCGHTITGQLLLEKGALIETRNKYHNTPLHYAALNGQTNMVELLLKQGALVETKGDCVGTPLHFAVESGQISVVKLLLEGGAFTEATDNERNTPLHYAAWYGHTNIAKLLLEKGALVEAIHIWGNTPLHSAAWQGHTNVVKLLLTEGASIETLNKNYKTPLDYAVQKRHTDIVLLLKRRRGY